MKKIKFAIAAFMFFGFTAIQAQVQQIDLTQQTGIFTTSSLTLPSGDYQFNISNDNVESEVGFVLVPKGEYDADHHIKEAYVTELVAKGTTSTSNVVSLAPGEYEYFCPMNKTPKYTLTVTEDADKPKIEKSDMMKGAKKLPTKVRCK